MQTESKQEPEQKISNEQKLKQAMQTIKNQQQYITDLTTSPFKLFDVNKQSKQYKHHLTRQKSSKKKYRQNEVNIHPSFGETR